MSRFVRLSTAGCPSWTWAVRVAAKMPGCGKKDDWRTKDVQVIDDNYRTWYEIFVYSFCDSDGDKIGDLQGVISKLDYIADMGFNGIWLMPIMPSNTYHKYDVKDYMGIDAAYGTMEDFDELVAECDKRGIKLIIDLVMNHTSSSHPWFVAACDVRLYKGVVFINSKIFLIVSGILIAVIAFIATFNGLLPSFISVPAVILYILFIIHIDND